MVPKKKIVGNCSQGSETFLSESVSTKLLRIESREVWIWSRLPSDRELSLFRPQIPDFGGLQINKTLTFWRINNLSNENWKFDVNQPPNRWHFDSENVTAKVDAFVFRARNENEKFWQNKSSKMARQRLSAKADPSPRRVHVLVERNIWWWSLIINYKGKMKVETVIQKYVKSLLTNSESKKMSFSTSKILREITFADFKVSKIVLLN